MTTHYDVLGLPPSATANEIHDRYRELAKEHHPDAGGAASRMAELNAAWDVLRDPGARRVYDRAHGLDSRRPASEEPRWQPGPRLMKRLTEHGFGVQHAWRLSMPDAPMPLSLRAQQHADFDVLPRLVGRQLWGLYAPDTWIDDHALAYVAQLSGLRSLDVSNTHVTDAGLEHVAKLRQLEELAVWGAHITDAGMPWIASMRRLVTLNIGATKVSDAAIGTVALLPRLQTLNLRETSVTEKGLLTLNKVPALRLLATPNLGPLARHRVGEALPGVTLT